MATGDKQQIRQRMDEPNFLRASKTTVEYPSCGSALAPSWPFYGKLIHDAGPALRDRGAQVSKNMRVLS